MSYFFDIAISFSLVILQTSILPSFSFFPGMFDLLIPFVVYLGLYRRVRRGIPMAILIGFIMDSISGAPFGVYLSTYIWLLIIVSGLLKYVRLKSSLILPFTIALGVFLEGFVFFGTLIASGGNFSTFASIVRIISIQVFWATLGGLIMFWFFCALYAWLDRIHIRLVALGAEKGVD